MQFVHTSAFWHGGTRRRCADHFLSSITDIHLGLLEDAGGVRAAFYFATREWTRPRRRARNSSTTSATSASFMQSV